MILHEVNKKSTLVKLIMNMTQGRLVKARRRALGRMKLQDIVPKHQILDNDIADAYKEEIRKTGMSYGLVPLDDHCHNIDDWFI